MLPPLAGRSRAPRRRTRSSGTAAQWLWPVPLLPLLGFVINGAAVARDRVSRRTERSAARAWRRSRRPRRVTAHDARPTTAPRRRSSCGRAASLRRHRRASSARACSCCRSSLAVGDLHGDARGRRRSDARAVRPALLLVDAGRRPADRRRVPARSALDDDDARRHRRRHADPPVQRRLHAGRPGLPALLRVPEPVRLLHAAAGARRATTRCCSSGGKASGSARIC